MLTLFVTGTSLLVPGLLLPIFGLKVAGITLLVSKYLNSPLYSDHGPGHARDPRTDEGHHPPDRGRRQGRLPPLHWLQHPGPGGQLGQGQGLN